MSPVTLCTTPSILTRTFVVLLLAYPLALIASRGPGRRHTLASVVIPVVLTPLFLGAGATLLVVARVMQIASLSGGGRAWRAAGIAEALVTTVFAAGVGSIAGAIAILQELLARKRGKHASVHAGAQIPVQIIAVSVAVATFSFAGILSWRAAIGQLTPREYLVPMLGACTAICAALGTCIWLLTLRRRDVAFQPSHPISASIAAVIACSTLGFAAWRVVQHFRAIAMGD